MCHENKVSVMENVSKEEAVYHFRGIVDDLMQENKKMKEEIRVLKTRCDELVARHIRLISEDSDLIEENKKMKEENQELSDKLERWMSLTPSQFKELQDILSGAVLGIGPNRS